MLHAHGEARHISEDEMINSSILFSVDVEVSDVPQREKVLQVVIPTKTTRGESTAYFLCSV